jgi:hypothetical protein
MTEMEWVACGNPDTMLFFLRDVGAERKLRLFATACCRRIWEWMTDERSRSAIEVAERHADGKASDEEWQAVSASAYQARYDSSAKQVPWLYGLPPVSLPARERAVAARLHATTSAAWDLCDGAIKAYPGQWGRAVAHSVALETARAANRNYQKSPERSKQCLLLRDIFGNPFRPVRLAPAWLTPTVAALAQAAYDERILPSGEFDPACLAILADALEDAGCTDTAILDHLRGLGPHVRGCWQLDLMLQKG